MQRVPPPPLLTRGGSYRNRSLCCHACTKSVALQCTSVTANTFSSVFSELLTIGTLPLAHNCLHQSTCVNKTHAYKTNTNTCAHHSLVESDWERWSQHEPLKLRCSILARNVTGAGSLGVTDGTRFPSQPHTPKITTPLPINRK